MKRKMKVMQTLLGAAAISAAVLMTMTAAAASAADDGILLRLRASGDSKYCHLKFPAIREETLSWDRPVLKSGSSGDIVDFYGSCNHDPRGRDEVLRQRTYWQRQVLDSGD